MSQNLTRYCQHLYVFNPVLSVCFINPMYVQAEQYKLGPEKFYRLGNSNVLQLPVHGVELIPVQYKDRVGLVQCTMIGLDQYSVQ